MSVFLCSFKIWLKHAVGPISKLWSGNRKQYYFLRPEESCKMIANVIGVHLSRLMTKPTMWLCAQRRLSDQPGHLPSLIRVFAVRMKKTVRLQKHWILSYPLSAQRRLWSDWAHMSVCWFCHEAAHFQLITMVEIQKRTRDEMVKPHLNVWLCRSNIASDRENILEPGRGRQKKGWEDIIN